MQWARMLGKATDKQITDIPSVIERSKLRLVLREQREICRRIENNEKETMVKVREELQ